ncbi:MAG: rhodanese-like domain-containing protein [Bacillota bacterium]|nr:rhodanese-like domain-containing protein [Bacillota bacterium]
MKKIGIIILSLFLLIGCTIKKEYKSISMEEAIKQMEQETDYMLVDVRSEEEYFENHIPGAINIPNESIGTEKIKKLSNKDQKIFVYCRSGNRSKQAAKKLVLLGYTNIVEIGGILDWNGALEHGFGE